MELEDQREFNSRSPDELRELYRHHPGRFNELADDAIKRACVGSTPEQTLKLRQMQWVIDANLRKGKTPLERMQIMERIFYGQVYGEDGYLAQLSSSCDDLLRAFEDDENDSEDEATLRLVKN